MNQPGNPHCDAPLAALIEAVLNGQADDAQFAELERRLQSDAAARDTYATYLNLHCDLRERFAVEGDLVGLEAELEREIQAGEWADLRRTLAVEAIRRAPRRSLFRRWLGLTALAALVLVGVFVADHFLRSPPFPLAQVRDLEGMVTIIGSTGESAARIGDVLRPGDRLRTDETNARAVLEYADGTKVDVHYDSVVQTPADGDVRLRLLAGSIEVDAAPQPVGHPLILATDHARYVVLGTHFRLYRNQEATRLELHEGKVQLEHQHAGQVVETVEIAAGNVAIASAEAVAVEVVPLAEGRAHLQATLAVTGRDVALSSGGDLLIVNDSGRGLKLCRTEDFSVQSEYARDASGSFGLALAPDGQTIVRLSHDHVLLWKPASLMLANRASSDADSTAKSASVPESQATKLPLAARPVRSRALSSDGRLVAESSDEGIELSVVDLGGSELKRIAVLPNLRGKSGKAWSLGFAAEGKYLAAGFWDGTLRVYNLESFAATAEYRLATTLTHCAISTDGAFVAAFNRKDGVVLIDTTTGKQYSLWSCTSANLTSLAFTPDGQWLMAGGGDRTARLWSIADARPVLVIDADHSPAAMAFLPARRWLITAAERVKVWECELPSSAP